MVQIPLLAEQTPYTYANSTPVFTSKSFCESITIEANDPLPVTFPRVREIDVPQLLYSPQESVIITDIEFIQLGPEATQPNILIYNYADFNYYFMGMLRGTISTTNIPRPTDSFARQLPALLYTPYSNHTPPLRGMRMVPGQELYYGTDAELDSPANLIVSGLSYTPVEYY